MPILIPFLRSLTESLNRLAGFAERHPTLTQGLMVTFAGLSALAALGGTLLVAGAGLKLAGLALTTITGLPLSTAAAGLATFAAALGPIVAIALAVANSDSIGKWADSHGLTKYNPFVLANEAGQAIGRRIIGDNPGRYGGAPPADNKTYLGTTVVQIDGRKVAEATTNYQYHSMNTEATSGSAFDWRSGYIPAALTGAP